MNKSSLFSIGRLPMVAESERLDLNLLYFFFKNVNTEI